MNNNIIAMDIDDVCANLVETWLYEYNRDYNDNLQKEDIVIWDISKFVKPECGNKIYKYIENPEIYNKVKPIENAQYGIQQLRKMGYRVFFCTSFLLKIAGIKFSWLKNNGFKPNEKDYVEMKDKSMINASYMLDDRPDNIKNFSGIGVIYSQPWNKSFTHSNRVNNWDEFIKFMYQQKELWA